jgi:E3 ubiquitin-protein ligase HERC2
MISHSVDVNSVGLGPNVNLLSSLKQHVVELASNIGVLNTIQLAAQATLQAGWSILLPTADERAKTLSALLPNAGNIHKYDHVNRQNAPSCLRSEFRL